MNERNKHKSSLFFSKSEVDEMSKKEKKKRTLIDALDDVRKAIDRNTAESKRMRGVWERASKPVEAEEDE